VIVVSDALLSPEAMAFYTFFTSAREPVTTRHPPGLRCWRRLSFYVATGGAGTLTARCASVGAGHRRQRTVRRADGRLADPALLFGLSGASLTSGNHRLRRFAHDVAAVLSYLNGINPQLDIDGDGQSDALTDGLLLIRYLFGLRGASRVAGAVGANATRSTARSRPTSAR